MNNYKNIQQIVFCVLSGEIGNQHNLLHQYNLQSIWKPNIYRLFLLLHAKQTNYAPFMIDYACIYVQYNVYLFNCTPHACVDTSTVYTSCFFCASHVRSGTIDVPQTQVYTRLLCHSLCAKAKIVLCICTFALGRSFHMYSRFVYAITHCRMICMLLFFFLRSLHINPTFAFFRFFRNLNNAPVIPALYALH